MLPRNKIYAQIPCGVAKLGRNPMALFSKWQKLFLPKIIGNDTAVQKKVEELFERVSIFGFAKTFFVL